VLLWLAVTLNACATELYANGEHIDTSPGIVIVEGRSYGPLRAVGEAVGAEITWIPERGVAEVCTEDTCYVVKKEEGLIREDRLLLPIRKLGEVLGGEVRWNGEQDRIDIIMPDSE
jgi:hypothetical protein